MALAAVAKEPAAQEEQLVAPALEVRDGALKKPAEQSRQPPTSDVGAKDPAGQDSQAAADVFTKEPGGQEPNRRNYCESNYNLVMIETEKESVT